MRKSPFPGTDPFLEINPRWEVFHGWFIRKYDVSSRPEWLQSYQDQDIPGPPLDESDRQWGTQTLQAWQPDEV